jgi:hypothetical protein
VGLSAWIPMDGKAKKLKTAMSRTNIVKKKKPVGFQKFILRNLGDKLDVNS